MNFVVESSLLLLFHICKRFLNSVVVYFVSFSFLGDELDNRTFGALAMKLEDFRGLFLAVVVTTRPRRSSEVRNGRLKRTRSSVRLGRRVACFATRMKRQNFQKRVILSPY